MSLSFTAALQAELLTADGRLPLVRSLAVPGELAEVLEVTLPDGTINLAVLPPRPGRLRTLLVTSDKAVQVRVGTVSRNAPVRLEPWGLLALLDTEVPATAICALSYTPGDGSVATCLVLALVYGETWGWTEPWEKLLPPFVPVTLWVEGWEID